MIKIKNLGLEDTDLSLGIKWSEVDSKIASLIKETDWIFLNDSDVSNLEEWKTWRNSVRSARQASNNEYGKAISLLRNLEERKPDIKKDFVNYYNYDLKHYESLDHYKEEIIMSLKRKYNKILLSRMTESGHYGLFHMIGKIEDDKTKKVIDKTFLELSDMISAVKFLTDVKQLETIFREANGHRH